MIMDEILEYIIEHGMRALLFWSIGVIVIVLVFGFFNFNPLGSFPKVDDKLWQAVFLENGQVYFGKLEEYDQNYVVLREVFYLREASDLEARDTANLNLIKLGGEVHGPEDEMYINKESILYFEDMKDTSRVVQSIVKSKN